MYEILDLIGQFGPIIVFAGTFVEGEVFAIVGGFLAYRGTYPLEFIALLAFAGSFLGDLAVFLFARFSSNHRWLARWRGKPKFAKAITLVERYQAYFVIVNRYIYGLRMPGLIALGLSRIGIIRFLLLNFIGAALWSTLFTGIGYIFGYSIQSVFARLEVMEQSVAITLGVILVLAAAWLAWRQWGSRLARKRQEEPRTNDESDTGALAVAVRSRGPALRGPGSKE